MSDKNERGCGDVRQKLNVSFAVRVLYDEDNHKCLFSDVGLKEYNYIDGKWYQNNALLNSLLTGGAMIMEE